MSDVPFRTRCRSAAMTRNVPYLTPGATVVIMLKPTAMQTPVGSNQHRYLEPDFEPFNGASERHSFLPIYRTISRNKTTIKGGIQVSIRFARPSLDQTCGEPRVFTKPPRWEGMTSVLKSPNSSLLTFF